MNPALTEQKTAVFAPVSRGAETRSFPVMDDDTRELPLIADRFAGRYWDGRAEEPKAEKPRRCGRMFRVLASVFAALLLFTGLFLLADGCAPAEPYHSAESAEAASETCTENTDTVTVLHARHGRGIGDMWADFIGTLGGGL